MIIKNAILLRAFFLPVALLAVGCGHTNNLAKFNFTGGTAFYRVHVSAPPQSYVSIQSPTTSRGAPGVVATIGSIIVSDQGRKKLEQAVIPDSIAGAISHGVQQATTDYLSLKPVGSIEDDPDFLVESNLTEFAFVSLAEGLVMRVKGESRVVHRKTGALVWENDDSYTIPLSETYLAGLAPAPVASGVSIYNAVKLLNLTPEEIAKVVDMAATQVGREIGESLRHDVAGIHGGK